VPYAPDIIERFSKKVLRSVDQCLIMWGTMPNDVLECRLRHGVKRLVLYSSVTAYNQPKEVPVVSTV